MNLSHHRAAAWAAILLAACGASHAAPAGDGAAGAWRCGNTYTDQPCRDGKPLQIDDARDAAHQRASEASTREARATADRLERERLHQEAALARRRPILIQDPPRPVQAQPAKGTAHARKNTRGRNDADAFSAYAPAATAGKKAKKAARRKNAAQD